MTKRYQVYKCALCGNMVEVLRAGEGQLTCCDQPMELQVEQTADSTTEKHVPVIEKIDGGYKVAVGSVLHPMTEKHYIEWIDLVAGDEVYRKFLKPDAEPVAIFKTDATDVYARAYCNLHGFWKS